MKQVVLGYLCLMALAGCTGNSGGSANITNPIDAITPTPPVIETPVTSPSNEDTVLPAEFSKPEAAVAKVAIVIETLNEDPNYAIVTDDLDLLVSEGIVESDSELKGWVK